MSKPVRVFEHEHLLHDEKTDFNKNRWKVLSDFNDKNENKYFTITAKGVRFHQYVGVVQIGRLTIEILPKIESAIDSKAKDRWHKNLLAMLRECHKVQSETLTEANLKLRSNSILDWYIEIFIIEVERLIHLGLVKKYRREEKNAKALKGRLKIVQHLRKNYVHQEQFFVETSVYDRNNVFNQIIYKTLCLIKSLSINPFLQSELNNVLLFYPQVNDVEINHKLFETLRYDRKSERYRKAMNIGKLLLLNYSPDIRHGQNNLIALLFDMNDLWEEYITLQIKKSCLDKWELFAQKKHNFWFADKYNTRRLQPDMVLKSRSGEMVVIDTKWKLLQDKGPSEEDLRQVYSYGNYFDANGVYLLFPVCDHNQYYSGVYNHQSFWKSQLVEGYSAGLIGINIMNENGGLNRDVGIDILETIQNA